MLKSILHYKPTTKWKNKEVFRNCKLNIMIKVTNMKDIGE